MSCQRAYNIWYAGTDEKRADRRTDRRTSAQTKAQARTGTHTQAHTWQRVNRICLSDPINPSPIALICLCFSCCYCDSFIFQICLSINYSDSLGANWNLPTSSPSVAHATQSNKYQTRHVMAPVNNCLSGADKRTFPSHWILSPATMVSWPPP